MRSKCLVFISFSAFSALSMAGFAQNPPAASREDKAWIAKSNGFTKLLVDIDEKYSPEFGSQQGLAFYDTLIAVPTLANEEAERKDRVAALVLLKNAKQTETNYKVKQDLDILINQSELDFRIDDFEKSREVIYLNATNTVFEGIHN